MKRAALVLAVRATPGLGNLVLVIVVARELGPKATGLLALASAVGQVALVVADAGQADRLLLAPGIAVFEGVLGGLRRLHAGIVGAAAGVAFGSLLLHRASHDEAAAVLAGLSYGLLLGLCASLSGALNYAGRLGLDAALTVIETVSMIAIGATLVTLQVVNVWALLLVFLPIKLGGLWLRWKVARSALLVPGERLGTMLRGGYPFFGFTMAQVVFMQVDVILLAQFASLEEVGHYQVAWRLVYFPLVLAEALNLGWVRQLVEDHSRVVEAPSTLARPSAGGYAYVGLAIALGLIASSRLVPTIFGEAFSPSMNIVIVLAFGLPFRFVSHFQSLLLAIRGLVAARFKFAVWYTLIGTVVMGGAAGAGGGSGLAASRVALEVAVFTGYAHLLAPRRDG